jgi:hypothetical protein
VALIYASKLELHFSFFETAESVGVEAGELRKLPCHESGKRARRIDLPVWARAALHIVICVTLGEEIGGMPWIWRAK